MQKLLTAKIAKKSREGRKEKSLLCRRRFRGLLCRLLVSSQNGFGRTHIFVLVEDAHDDYMLR